MSQIAFRCVLLLTEKLGNKFRAAFKRYSLQRLRHLDVSLRVDELLLSSRNRRAV